MTKLFLYCCLFISCHLAIAQKTYTASVIQHDKFNGAIDTLEKGYTEIGLNQMNESLKGGLLKPKYVAKQLQSTSLTTEQQAYWLRKAQLHHDRHSRKKNKEVAALMVSLLERDQKHRKLMYGCAGDRINLQTVRDSCSAIYDTGMLEDDAFCLGVIDSISNEFGWINESWGGDTGTVWAIIHHNRSVLRETNKMDSVLQAAKQAYLDGEFGSFPSLEDGELLYNCQPQKHNTFSCKDANGKLVPCTPYLFNKKRCPQ